MADLVAIYGKDRFEFMIILMLDKASAKDNRRTILTAKPQTVRHLNRAVILDLIRQNQPLSRAELARLSGMHRSNISNIVEGLLRKELLREERAKNFGRGRAPDLISFDRNAFRVMAISLRRAHTTMAIATLGAHIENSFTFETPDSPEKFAVAVEDAYRTLLQNVSLMEEKESPVRQIVVSIPGIVTVVNADKTTIWTPGLPKYSGTNLAGLLRKRIGIPTLTANNAGLAALSLIKNRDSGSDLPSDFVLLVIGDAGVGSGVVIQRSLYSGFDAAFAGEVGHTVIDPRGPPCNCGRSGCWQLYVCDEATWKRYKPTVPFSPSRFEEFLDAIEAGSQKARIALRQTVEYLSLGISNIALTFNPERIVLAGSLMRIWPLLEKEMRSAFFLPHHRVLLQPTSIPVDTLFLKGAVERALSIVLSDF